MSTHRRHHPSLDPVAEAELQALAADAPRDGEAPQVDLYRQLYAVLRDAPIAEPPLGFARQMQRMVLDAGEQAGVEVWVQRLIALFALAAATIYAVPPAAQAIGSLIGGIGLPWPMLFGAMLTLLATWAVDEAWLGGGQPPG